MTPNRPTHSRVAPLVAAVGICTWGCLVTGLGLAIAEVLGAPQSGVWPSLVACNIFVGICAAVGVWGTQRARLQRPQLRRIQAGSMAVGLAFGAGACLATWLAGAMYFLAGDFACDGGLCAVIIPMSAIGGLILGALVSGAIAAPCYWLTRLVWPVDRTS